VSLSRVIQIKKERTPNLSKTSVSAGTLIAKICPCSTCNRLFLLYAWLLIIGRKVENIGFGFGMVFLSSVQAEIYVFSVWAFTILGSDLQ